jgi:predicted RNA binding protein YcfA (HicA-like mRNA interferase family)
MTRIDKLYERLLVNPRATISFRDFEKLLKAFGFEHVRTTGSHRQYVHPKLSRTFPVQPSDKDAKRYQVREFLELVEEHGLYIEP